MNFVFGIGLPKTGTTSLHFGLCKLGFKSIHNVGFANRSIKRAIRERRSILYYLNTYNAFTDAPFYEHYRTLDRQYPGSRFIFTTRNIDDWFVSQKMHNEIWNKLNPDKKPRIFGADTEQKWRKKWAVLNSAVHKYFCNRSDFLELDICSGHGYEMLCPFLGLSIPDEHFPHQNQTAKKLAKYGI